MNQTLFDYLECKFNLFCCFDCNINKYLFIYEGNGHNPNYEIPCSHITNNQIKELLESNNPIEWWNNTDKLIQICLFINQIQKSHYPIITITCKSMYCNIYDSQFDPLLRAYFYLGYVQIPIQFKKYLENDETFE